MTAGLIVRVVGGPSTGTATAIETLVVAGREGDLALDDPTVSRSHVSIGPSADGVRVTDLDSRGGVFVGTTRVRQAEVLPGQTFAIGRSTLLVQRFVRFSESVAEPAFRISHDGKDRVIPVRDGSTIGRDDDADIQIDDSTVSRQHAVVRAEGKRFVLHDAGSTNGTVVDGRQVRDAVQLSNGSTVTVGRSTAELTFHSGAVSSTVTVQVSVEPSSRRQATVIDASPDATIAEVTRDLARLVAAPPGPLLLYRRGDGVLLHPDDRWSCTGVRTGDHVVLGVGDATEFEPAPGRHWPEQSGRSLNQLPRTVWPATPFHLEHIEAPESASFRGRGVQWQIGGGIGATMLGLALAIVNPSYAIFGIITGGIGILSIAASVLGEQSRRRHRIRAFRERLTALDDSLAAARTDQAAALHDLSPSNEGMESWVEQVSPRIWERRPEHADALQPTIGTGRRTTRVDLERGSRNESPHAAELAELIAKHAHLEGVPITGPGASSGSFGVCGPNDATSALLRRIVVESALMHPPSQLSIWVITDEPGWEWCRWLPHVSTVGLATDVVAVRSAIEGSERNDSRSIHLVVVPSARRASDVKSLIDAGRDRLVVVAAADERDLPSGLAAVCDVDGSGRGSVRGFYPEAPPAEFAVAGMPDHQAENIAVGLGRLGGADQTAAPTGLVELLDMGTAVQPDIAGSWNRADGERLTVRVGSDDAGDPVEIGFRRDGPHGMIAGTTGSGKSELLQTVLVALALTNSPERLQMFLVDFKGGSTFAPISSLPHVVGLVTDLEQDPALATRALVALDAEIDRRKRVLDAAGVPDVIAYERAGIQPPLPDLLVVIDEFALLVERQPDVRDRLDTIATQGRSLGVHLLLATQSPSGVISHAIRTNTNLWICLRVVVDSESMEILGAPDAAQLPDSAPGRAFIRLGASPNLRGFQAARIGRPLLDRDARVRVSLLAGSSQATPATSFTTTELEVVVAHIAQAAIDQQMRTADPLWLPPLPTVLEPAQIPLPSRTTERLQVVLGLADHPREHAQTAFTVDLSSSGHAVVCGVFGFGKSTALTQVAVDLASAYSPADVHIMAIDGGAGSLTPLERLPHVGGVVGSSDVERLTRLIDRLTRTVESRREQLATTGVGDFLRWRSAGDSPPWIVLLVDDFAAFRETAEQVEMGRLLDRFNALLQNAPAVGIHVVVAISQAGEMRSRELNLVLARLVLRAADAADYALVDVRLPANHTMQFPPGRALGKGGVEVQLCLPDDDDISAAAARWRHVPSSALPGSVRRLPREVHVHELTPTDRELVFAVGGADVEPVGISTSHGGVVLLVAGPSQSGRTETLMTLLTSLQPDPARVLVIAPRPNALRGLAETLGFACHPGSDGVDVVLDDFAASAGAGAALVIDDAEIISGASGLNSRMEALLRTAADTGLTVLVAARINDLSGMFDPWSRYLVSLRRAILLSPTVDDAFLFGCKMPVIPPPLVPGRGLIIDRTRVEVVQVAAFDRAGSEVGS